MRKCNTVADVIAMAEKAGANYLVTTDRGNGSAGPSSIDVADRSLYVDDAVLEVYEEDDPEAWRLAREALYGDEPQRVWLGRRGDGSNPPQMIYVF